MVSVSTELERQMARRLAAGETVEVRRLLAEAVRADPGDQRARMFLFQVLCVDREWEKALAQLRSLATLSPDAQMLAVAYGQVIDGERARRTAFAEGRPVPMLVAPTGWAVEFAAAMTVPGERAGISRARALDACPDSPGDVDGRAFDFLFDGDGRFGPMVEAIVAGRWGAIPFAAIDEIVTDGPIDLRDTVWLPAEIRFRDGPAVGALLPVRYPGIEKEAAGLRLARETEWREVDGVVHGAGQRVWTTSDGEDVPILSFRRIRFRAAS